MPPWASLTARATARKKKLFSDRGEGEKIFFYEARDDYGEASFVVDTIAQLVASANSSPAIVR
jgi:superfamily I DNA/RNA helicase